MRTIGPRRRGFTLLELLWVVFIISVLIALLLPAVQSSREQARRAQCQNNLLQLSLATRSYESVHRVYPPGVVNDTGPIFHVGQGYHASWIVQILPFLEQRSVARKLNPRYGVYAVENATATQTVLSSLLCPSDPFRPNPNMGPISTFSSYAACHDDENRFIDADNNGVFFLNSKVRDEDIPDGLSTTAFFGEKRGASGQSGWASGTRATLRNMGFLPNESPDAKSRGAGLNGMMFSPSGGQEPSPFGDPTPADEEDEADGPAGEAPADGAAPPPPKRPKAPLTPGISGGFSSHHNTGVNFAFGDGSIRFVKESVDPSIYKRIGNRRDLGLVSEDSF